MMTASCSYVRKYVPANLEFAMKSSKWCRVKDPIIRWTAVEREKREERREKREERREKREERRMR